MAATLRELRGRIRSAGSIKKITKAQEMIATSRIAKAQARVEAARPYDREITNMLTELASASALDHPLLVARENPRRAGVLVVTSDRGLCGAYNANVFRRSEELFSLLRSEGKEPVLYVVGRKALNYYSFRNWDVPDVLDRLLRAARLRERAGDRVDVGRCLHRRYGRRRRRSRSRQHPRCRRTAHRVHRVQVDAVAVGDRPAYRTDGGGVQRGGHRTAARCSPSSRTPRPCSARCCRGTYPPASSPRCSRRRHRSRRRVGAP